MLKTIIYIALFLSFRADAGEVTTKKLIKIPIVQDISFSSGVFYRNFYGSLEEDSLRIKLFDCLNVEHCNEGGLVVKKNRSEKLFICSNDDFICLSGAISFSYPRKLTSNSWSFNEVEYFLIRTGYNLRILGQNVSVNVVSTKKPYNGYLYQYLYSEKNGLVAITQLEIDEEGEISSSNTYFLKDLPGLVFN
jgi:hypothetical protein